MSSPFKVLEAYTQADREIFFGRDAEIELLFKKTTESNLVLVYGASGTGKTSLVHCGLPIRFSQDDWLPIYIRRKDHIGTAILEEINKTLQRKLKPHTPLHLAVKALHMTYFRPIYLIIDQFEELYVSGTEEEQREFYDFVENVLESQYNCKIILVMREEYLADLSEFEERVPMLFDHRVRVEKMRKSNAREVILKSAHMFDIVVEDAEETVELIISEVAEERSLIELTYLQIYLDRLYELAKAKQPQLAGNYAADSYWQEAVIFSPQLVKELSSLGDVLGEYLEEQVQKVQAKLTLGEEYQIWIILNLLATEDGTRRSMDLHTATNEMYKQGASHENIEFCLRELSKVRIVHLSDQRVELAHDSLAAKIVERKSAEEKNLTKAKEILQTGLKTYETTNEVLSKTMLAFVEPYLDKLKLTYQEEELLRKSRNRAKRNRMLQITLLGIVIFILTLLALWALRERSVAIDRRDQLEEVNLQLQRNNEQTTRQLEKSIETSKELDRQLGKIIEKEKVLEDLLRVNGKTYQLLAEKDQKIKQLEITSEALKNRLDTKDALTQRIEKTAKSNELIAKAFLMAEEKPEYALRLAEAAHELNPTNDTKNTIIEIFRKDYFRRFRNTRDPIWTQAQNLLKSNLIPTLSFTQKQQLGILAFEE